MRIKIEIKQNKIKQNRMEIKMKIEIKTQI